MELWYTTTSPFARKVRIAAVELGLAARITLVPVTPLEDASLRRLNPLAKVPTLVLEDGAILFESSVICAFLDARILDHSIVPQAGQERWRALQLQGLADGAMTIMVRLFAEEHRAPEKRSAMMMEQFAKARDASLEWLERADPHKHPTIGEISVAAFLGYLDFRWPDRDWRPSRPALSHWFHQFGQRPSMLATRHSL